MPRPARPSLAFALAVTLVFGLSGQARGFGEASAVEVRAIDYAGGHAQPRPSATRRLAWELRQRTSVETRLEPSAVRLDDSSIFATPLLYWSGDAAFEPLSEAELRGLKRFVEFGGFVLIDDASPEASGFDESIRREIARAFGPAALQPLPSTHTVYRSFYLVDRPVGRVRGPDSLEAVVHAGRAAVVYSRHDLGGAWARDNLGNWEFTVLPGRESQREMAYRLGVNLVMYALCLDYKDDQVHVPFIMRRHAGR